VASKLAPLLLLLLELPDFPMSPLSSPLSSMSLELETSLPASLASPKHGLWLTTPALLPGSLELPLLRSSSSYKFSKVAPNTLPTTGTVIALPITLLA